MPNFFRRSSIPHSGRRLIRSARIATNSTVACATTPRVVPIPSTSSLALPISTGLIESSPGTRTYNPRVRIATTLFTTGAHAGGPKMLRVFRIAMKTEDKP